MKDVDVSEDGREAAAVRVMDGAHQVHEVGREDVLLRRFDGERDDVDDRRRQSDEQ